MARLPRAPGGRYGAVKRLIVNADDFGWSEAVTAGILRAHRDGVVTSTTLMANLPGAAETLARAAQEAPRLAVGLHLNLTQGRPLAPPGAVEALLDGGGQLPPSLVTLAWRLRFSAPARRAAEREIDAQMLWAEVRGWQPSHVDGHKHVHLQPVLVAGVLAAARRHGIPAVRTTDEFRLPGVAGLLPREWGAAARARQWVLEHVGRRWGRAARLAIRDAGLATTDWFFGLRATGGVSTDLVEHLLRHAPSGTGELMVHPGLPETVPARPTRLAASRPRELEALCDPRVRRAAEAAGWTWATFEDLTHE